MNEVSSGHYPRMSNTALSGVNIVIGIWLIMSTFLLSNFSHLPYARFNNEIVGILVMICSAVRFGTNTRASLSWCNVVLGIWMIISPFALGFHEVAGAMWHNMIVGTVVSILGWIRALSPGA